MVLVVEILGALVAVGDAFLRLVDFGVKISSAEQEMSVARLLLDIFKGTVSDVQSSRDRLTRALTPIVKQRIDRHLSHASSLVEAYENALRHHIVADEILPLGGRASWVFKDKKKVEGYWKVLEKLQTALEGLCEDMDRLEAISADLRGDEKPLPRPQTQADVVCAAVRYGMKFLVEAAGNSENEQLELSPCTTNESVESAIPSNFKLETSIAADLKRRFERKPGILPPPRIQVSITADLKRRFMQRGLGPEW